MLYQINNKAQAVGIADFSVHKFLSVLETSYSESVEFNANTVGDAGACRMNRGWQQGKGEWGTLNHFFTFFFNSMRKTLTTKSEQMINSGLFNWNGAIEHTSMFMFTLLKFYWIFFCYVGQCAPLIRFIDPPHGAPWDTYFKSSKIIGLLDDNCFN